jgi:hypothetical protein
MHHCGQVTLEQVRAQIAQFADEREWRQYHTPRNLLLALVGEVTSQNLWPPPPSLTSA